MQARERLAVIETPYLKSGPVSLFPKTEPWRAQPDGLLDPHRGGQLDIARRIPNHHLNGLGLDSESR